MGGGDTNSADSEVTTAGETLVGGEQLPTPLRQRVSGARGRTNTPPPVAKDRSPAATVPVAPEQLVRNPRPLVSLYPCFALAAALGLLAVLGTILAFTPWQESGDRADQASDVDAEKEKASCRHIDIRSLAGAIGDPSKRADLFDVLAGATFEFGDNLAGADILTNLRKLVAAADVATDTYSDVEAKPFVGANVSAEAALVDSISSLSAAFTDWPFKLRGRVCGAIRVNGGVWRWGRADIADAGDRGLPLSVDVDASSSSVALADCGWVCRTLRSIGVMTGLARYRRMAQPADVVISPDKPIRGECFAFSRNATIVLNVLGNDPRGRRISSVVVEQPPRWAVPSPATSPRRFSVYSAEVEAGESGEHMVPLGDFEYAVAGPAKQSFELRELSEVRSLHLKFDGEGWGGRYTCVYRIRIF
eukprot:TRINITY_DN44799_c0_g1_i1.p1 TRINITY_DN44799_c0_g1~~TRINITY_DN44799_c0_g1_i1.p1  ORF type:complete len:419 (+),score=66.16 TRINITY_DN44799_c0_g1_i1:57-1313(+)